MQVIVNKLLTSYSEIGSGSQILLLLHGWADSGKTFDMLARELIAVNKNYKLILLDLPGFGATSEPDTAWGLEDYALFVADFIKKINKTPITIIGHSNGGAIAINGLANGVLSASTLILIGSAGVRTTSVKKEAMRLVAKPAKFAIKVTPKSTQKRIRQKLYSAIGSDYLVAEHLQETFKKVVSYDVRQEAASLTMPVCLIYGEKDTATSPEYGKILSEKIPDASLHVLPEAGHFVHQEQAHKVANLIANFLTTRGSK